VRLAFGPGWDAAVPVLRVLSVAGVMSVFGQISLHLMSAHSLLGRLTAVALTGAALRIVLLLALIPGFGVAGAAWAAAIATCAEQGVTTVMALRRLRVGARAFLIHIVRPVVAAVVMTCAILAAGLFVPGENVVWLLTVEIATGVIVYTLVSLMAWLVAGRPDGPETETLRAIHRAVVRT
jgi:O-antigen/teichoic acid export membrane protein